MENKQKRGEDAALGDPGGKHHLLSRRLPLRPRCCGGGRSQVEDTRGGRQALVLLVEKSLKVHLTKAKEFIMRTRASYNL